MTFEALEYAISNLLIKRQNAHGNDQEQARITTKLVKLYDLKYTMIRQKSGGALCSK